MRTRRLLFGAVALAALFGASPARAEYRVYSPYKNFLVTAPTREVAEEFARKAEDYRREKALQWVGHEMPPWPQPCPLVIHPKPHGAGGATKFDYNGSGGYAVLSMDIEGDLERMLNSVLPHEVTHTVFADHFRYPVPRWADEGGSVLSEDDRERNQHDQLCRNLLNSQQKFPLRRLFNLKEYHELNGVPSGVMVLYAEGYSVTNYLVGLSGRPVFLQFVAIGMRNGWDQAVQTCYHVQSVEQLEEGWLAHLRATRKGAPIQLAQNTQPARPVGELTNRSWCGGRCRRVSRSLTRPR